jgi:hypothetical protein
MLKRIHPGALALAMTLGVAGCPGGKDPKPDSGVLALADYCAGIPELIGKVFACQHGDPTFLGSTVGCVAMEAEVAAGRLSYDGDRARACVDAWKAATCDALDGVGPACDGILGGNVANGGVCLDDVECATGHCRVDASCPGVCTAYVGLDGDCSAAGAKCAPDLYCRIGRCAAPPAPAKQGEACVTRSCASGLYCDPGTKTCAPNKKSGSCADAPDACASGYACVDSGTCAVYRGRGEHCGVDARCGLGWACIDGICGPAPGVGSACAVNQAGIDCSNAAYCDTSGATAVCRARKPGGATCTDYAECQSFACTAGTCEFGTCVQ